MTENNWFSLFIFIIMNLGLSYLLIASGFHINNTALGSESWVVALTTSTQSIPQRKWGGKVTVVVLFLLWRNVLTESNSGKKGFIWLILIPGYRSLFGGVNEGTSHTQPSAKRKQMHPCLLSSSFLYSNTLQSQDCKMVLPMLGCIS